MGENLNGTINISVNRYNELLSIETRAMVLIDTVRASKYNVSSETIATILGFKLPKAEKEEGPF